MSPDTDADDTVTDDTVTDDTVTDDTVTDDTVTDDTVTDDTVTDDTDEAPPVEERYGAPVTGRLGQAVIHPSREQYVASVGAARDDGFAMLCDVTAVDYLGHEARTLPAGIEPERFEVVVNLLDPTARRRLRVRVQVPGTDASIATIYPLYPGADAAEREILDLFGIAIDGHPDPTRILMPEDWIGHPLRKDVPQGKIPVQFKSATNVR